MLNSTIVTIGSGNLATHITLALHQAGAAILQVCSPTRDHAVELAARAGAEAVASLADTVPDADYYIIAVKDDAIPNVVAGLDHVCPDSVVLHTAGSVPMSVFRDRVGRYGVLYPMQTFSKARQVDFSSIPCFVEASDEIAMGRVRELAEGISHSVIVADSSRRRRLHLAAVFACNMANHCYRLAERVLEGEDIDFRLFSPLIEETARKIQYLTPREAQTGPMVRNDVTVMDAQVQLLGDDTMRSIYRLMAESIYRDSKG